MVRTLVISVFFVLVATASASAMPQHKETLERYYGNFLDAALRRCATCHIVPAGVTEEDLADSDPEHNAFGKRLRELGEELTAGDHQADLVSRLKKVSDEDADGDGVSNELELLSGMEPGDPASVPSAEQIASAKAKRDEFTARYQWDSWKPVRRPDLPLVTDSQWPRNPIDAFIAAEHKRQQLTARHEAPKHVLLRRVYLDLIGLPPTAEELEAFLNDPAPDAYERTVDSLLSRPEYGERWGRHWMDVWRYSDWAGWGEQVRDSMPHVWRWRDWIIESLNADKTYDRMVIEMLAADEYCPEDADALRATGFLVRNYKRLSREQWMQDTVNHTAKAFLGATLDCARCHDHKYDPVSQEEYYRFRAIFEPYDVRTDRIAGEVNVDKAGLVRSYDADPSVATYLFVRGDDRQPDKERVIQANVPVAFEGASFNAAEIAVPQLARVPDKRPFVIEDDLKAAADAAVEGRRKANEARQRCSAAEQAAASDASTDEAQKTLADAQREARQSELEAVLLESKRAALEATVQVERLEEQGIQQSDPAGWESAAKNALAAQRQHRLAEKRKLQFEAQDVDTKAQAAKAEAEQNLVAAPDDAARKEALDAATKALDEAQKNLAAADEGVKTAETEAAAELTTAYAPRELKGYPDKSTGRRLALGQWLANPQNPRTSRVAINQIWMRHFGQPLVTTVFDFGNNGQPPTHPALLDWLAAEFMQPSLALTSTSTGSIWQPATNESAAPAWSMKHIHRLIVTSTVYRMASTPDAACAAIDPDNRYYWRMPSRRMEAEVVRDCVLYVAGQLDLTRGGPDLDYDKGLTVYRRSLYFRHAPEKQMTFLRLFDAASPDECYRRKESVVPQQALALANSSLSLEQSRRIARALHQRFADTPQFITAAFAQVLSRPATNAEIDACVSFLQEQQSLFAASTDRLTSVAADEKDSSRPSADLQLRTRENLVHVLLNHNDFVTIR